MDAVLPQEQNFSQQASQKNVYHLHSILIHRGGLGAGHYYSFIRPTLEDKWYEFNDSSVTEIMKSTAFANGCGGPETYFELKDGKVIEKQRPNNTSAYMLVYIRESERESIMRELTMDDIPGHLKLRFDDENKMNQKIQRVNEELNECGQLYIISGDSIKGWSEGGVFQLVDDIYKGQRFYDNDEQRMMVKINRKSKICELLTLIRRKTNYPPNHLVLYRVRF